MEEKCADPTIQMDIDEMTLDYLLFTTTKVILEYDERNYHESTHGHGTIDLLLQSVQCQCHKALAATLVNRCFASLSSHIPCPP